MDWHVWLTIVLPRPHAIWVKSVCLLHAKGMSNIVCVCVSTDEFCRCDISRLRDFFVALFTFAFFLFVHVCDIFLFLCYIQCFSIPHHGQTSSLVFAIQWCLERRHLRVPDQFGDGGLNIGIIEFQTNLVVALFFCETLLPYRHASGDKTFFGNCLDVFSV